MTTVRHLILLALLLSAGCEPVLESPCDGTTCDRAGFVGGKADGDDWCARYGWYDDDDNYCDDPGGYCAMPDPDCGAEVDACGDTDLSQGMRWGGDPAIGCVADAPPAPADRQIEVLFTNPFCDECSTRDKAVLLVESPIIARVVELIDGAERSVHVAQFTFSRRSIEDALVRAHDRGVEVQVAMDAAQERRGSLAQRLRGRGVDVRFVAGRGNGGRTGIQHDKFMIVDETTLLTGSNNWSSTGTSINEENTIVIQASATDPYIAGFTCHFAAIWAADHDAAGACSEGDITFAPGGAPRRMIRDALREADTSIDVLMHHFTFTDLVDELADAQERGVQVRVILNEETRAEHAGRSWDRLVAAGGRIRYKRNNESAYQLMHHKLAIVDGQLLLNGSGNWSGSGFFNNFENYIAYHDADVVRPFVSMYARLWRWSLSGAVLDAGGTAATQLDAERSVYFGSLHGHVHATEGGDLVDDGHASQRDADGVETPVAIGSSMAEAARYAFEYARDRGGLDFVAITPHTSDAAATAEASQANMTQTAYDVLRSTATEVSDESSGAFVALPGMEWSTNSTGNHVNVLGSSRIAGIDRGRFDRFYSEFLAGRTEAGEQPIVMMNHPRTFRQNLETLSGSWDQEYGILLTEISSGSQRRQKFNDYGLDDFAPLSGVRQRWIDGEVMPEYSVVVQTLATLWQASAPYARLMEVTLNRGTEFADETARNPSLSVAEDGTISRRVKVHSDWDYYLSHGFRLAPVASHDNHYANWGAGHTSRTAIVADQLSSASLLDALRTRSVYASEDENLSLGFYVAGRVPMGGELQTTERTVQAQIVLSDPDYTGPYEVRVYQGAFNGENPTVVSSQTVPGGWTELSLMLSTGAQYAYVEVREIDSDRMAWSAPIWITAR
ncbi:MAG TPA: hypothetical protein ENK57_24645 [Polyangiaceae bacterium]|nr:hypothetical protein [Polyangiaceae bacterium]